MSSTFQVEVEAALCLSGDDSGAEGEKNDQDRHECQHRPRPTCVKMWLKSLLNLKSSDDSRDMLIL